jgi:hypothetical protein
MDGRFSIFMLERGSNTIMNNRWISIYCTIWDDRGNFYTYTARVDPSNVTLSSIRVHESEFTKAQEWLDEVSRLNSDGFAYLV